MEEVQLRGDEGSGVPVACPASYVDAVEGFVEEGAELGEGGEDEWVVGGEKEMCWWVRFDAEMEGLWIVSFCTRKLDSRIHRSSHAFMGSAEEDRSS